ncbi:DNA-binding response regulator [Rhodoferax lacus]|uniref:DNA-binding response regulator n=1 Tax=Rhodoferax lacus TaxID=2184758 RepID=A0A3E1RC71_9BURK|nr:response regulator transcription factor [Rhodoferax lacus]RFO96965.1 DNA-binding response regulator [Rhodoferax lacus]
MIRIVIADDHAIVRAGLKQMFAIIPEMEVVAEAVDGDSVLEALRHTRCDVLLLDLNMPSISGPDLIGRLKAHWPSQPILVLSMHDTAQVASRALKAGADGYVTKDSEPEVLLAAIRKVASGGRFISSEVAQRMALLATVSGDRLPHNALSAREFDVFKCLVKGLGVNDIADQLNISNKTVSTHKARLLEKMQMSSIAELTRYAMDNQLMD